MAITVSKSPPLYVPLNLILFQMSSNIATIIAFKVTVIDVVSGGVIAIQKYYPLPQIANATSCNLAPLLSGFVQPQLVKSNNIVESVPNIYKRFRVQAAEIYRDGTGAAVTGANAELGTYYTWDCTLNRVAFSTYAIGDYTINNGAGAGRFLNQRPLVSSVYYSSVEYLYLISPNAMNVTFKFYKTGGILIGTHTESVPNSVTNQAFRINVSPSVLALAYGDDLLNAYGTEFADAFDLPFGTLYGLTAANYFTVQCYTTGGAAVGEMRTYALKADDCKKSMLELLFSNSLGGYDTLAFTEPIQTITSTKTKIDTNPYQYDAAGNYTDSNGAGVFNPSSAVIGSSSENSFSVVSEPMHDSISAYTKALFESENVFAILPTGQYYPVTLDDQPYTIGKKKYSTNNNRLTISFKITDTNFTI